MADVEGREKTRELSSVQGPRPSREEESEGGRRRNECRAEWQSGRADVEGGEEKINLKSLREGGNRTQGHGLVEMRRLLEVEGGQKLRDLCSQERPQGRDRRGLP